MCSSRYSNVHADRVDTLHACGVLAGDMLSLGVPLLRCVLLHSIAVATMVVVRRCGRKESVGVFTVVGGVYCGCSFDL